MKNLSLLPPHELRNELYAALCEKQAIAAEAGKVGASWIICVVAVNGGVFLALSILKIVNAGRMLIFAFLFLQIIAVITLIVLISFKESKKTNAAVARLHNKAVALPGIPREYRHADALAYMISRIDNGAASTWKECMEQYDQEAHRRTLEKKIEEVKETVERIARS